MAKPILAVILGSPHSGLAAVASYLYKAGALLSLVDNEDTPDIATATHRQQTIEQWHIDVLRYANLTPYTLHHASSSAISVPLSYVHDHRAIVKRIEFISQCPYAFGEDNLGAIDAHIRRGTHTRTHAYYAGKQVAPVFVINSPLSMFVIDHWMSLTQSFDVRLLGIFRHPNNVALSHAVRDQLPRTTSVPLWSAYNFRLLELQKLYEFPLLCFDYQWKTFNRDLAAASRCLGLTITPKHEQDIALDPRNRHHNTEYMQIATGHDERAIALYDSLFTRVWSKKDECCYR